MNWSSGWLMSGLVSRKKSSMTQLMSGANASVDVFMSKEHFEQLIWLQLTQILTTLNCSIILWTLNQCYCVKYIRIVLFRSFVFHKVTHTTVKAWWEILHGRCFKFIREHGSERILIFCICILERWLINRPNNFYVYSMTGFRYCAH